MDTLLAVPRNNVDDVAQQARVDAMDYIADVRDFPPAVLWNRLHEWMQKDPHRLCAMVTALAAMCPIDMSVRDVFAWTEGITQR